MRPIVKLTVHIVCIRIVLLYTQVTAEVQYIKLECWLEDYPPMYAQQEQFFSPFYLKYHRSHCSISSFVCEKGYVVKTCFLELQSHTCSLIFWARQLQDSATVNLQLIICLAVGDAINPLSSFACSGSSKRYLHIVHKSCACIVTIVTTCLGFCMDPCCVFSNRCSIFWAKQLQNVDNAYQREFKTSTINLQLRIGLAFEGADKTDHKAHIIP